MRFANRVPRPLREYVAPATLPRPTELEPAPDEIAGVNLPYRGDVDHGVPANQPDVLPDDGYHGNEVETTYIPEEENQTPIPVKIVTENQREIRDWRAYSVPIGELSTQSVCARDDTRTRVRMRVRQGSVFVSSSRDSVGAANGVLLEPAQGYVDIGTTEPVYARGQDSTIDVIVEFVRPVK